MTSLHQIVLMRMTRSPNKQHMVDEKLEEKGAACDMADAKKSTSVILEFAQREYL